SAGRSRVAPNPAVIVQLIKVIARSDDSHGFLIVIETLPPRTCLARAGRSGVAPNPAVVVQLVKRPLIDCESHSLWIGDPPTPPRTRVAVTSRSSEFPHVADIGDHVASKGAGGDHFVFRQPGRRVLQPAMRFWLLYIGPRHAQAVSCAFALAKQRVAVR